MPGRGGRNRGGMFVICDICSSTISSAEEYDRHMAGRKHNERLQSYLEKKRAAESSVFVKGFPARTQENEMAMYFSNFGMVTKVVFEVQDKKKQVPPRYCIVEFQKKESAKNAVDYEPHILNSCRLTVRPRSFKELKLTPYFPWEKEKEEEEKAMLPWNQNRGDMGPGPDSQGPGFGGPPGEEEFYMDDFDYGGNFRGYGGRGAMGGPGFGPRPPFGPRGMMGPGPGFGPGPFGPRGMMGPGPGGYPGMRFGPPGDRPPPQSLLDLNTGFGSGFKRVKGMPSLPGMGKKARKGRGADDPQDPLPITVPDLKKKFSETSSITIQSQMQLLVDTIQASPEELQQRYYICKVLEQALTPFFPGVTVNQFGSSVNGFGLKGCDMDVYISLDSIGMSVRSGTVELPYTRDIHSLKKHVGPLTQADVDGMTNGDKGKLISRILIEHAPSCSNTQVIPSNRCPIIRFKHESSGIKCDLSIDNKLALLNTRLLQAFSQYDPRIKPLVYTIRYWGRLKHLAGNIKTGPRMSNYALTLMVIYYLQNTNPCTLPTVQQLSDLSTTKTVVNGWDCSFVSSNFIPPTQNIQTCEELLAGFFKFFSEFDFKANALSLRTGTVLPVAKITLENTMKIGPINIQDPFVLDHNVTQNMNETIRDLFIRELSIAAYKAERWQALEFAQTKNLIDVLDEKIPDGFDPSLVMSSVPGMRLGEYQFVVELKAPSLSPQMLRSLEAEGDLYTAWCKRMIGFVYNMIEKILMFDCEIIATNVSDIAVKSRKYDHAERSEQSLRRGMKRSRESMEDDGQGQEEGQGEGEGNEGQEKGEDQVEEGQGKSENQGEGESKGEDESGSQDNSGAAAADVDMYDPRAELYSDAQFFIDMNSYIMCRMWAERKKIGNILKERGFGESLELEQSISERLYYDNHYEGKKPILEMRIILKSMILNNRAEILVDVSGPPGQSEFHCVYHYIKKYILKMVDKFFAPETDDQ